MTKNDSDQMGQVYLIFNSSQLSKIHLSLLFIFIVSFSFASEVLALTATRQYDIATFDHTAGKQRYTI